MMKDIQIYQFDCRDDNFGVIIYDPESDNSVAIDAPDATKTLSVLNEKRWKLTAILVTHHHLDHTEGLAELKKETHAVIYGPEVSIDKIKNLDLTLNDKENFNIGGMEIKTIATPGHTLDMISYYIPLANAVFTGDTLFAMGCGRIFEGDANIMWTSLKRLIDEIPPETKVYCGHEYTLANAKFAVTVDPHNDALKQRLVEVEALRKNNLPTLPTTMALELQTNPFLRPDDPEIQKNLNMVGAPPEEVFAELRKRKDNF